MFRILPFLRLLVLLIPVTSLFAQNISIGTIVDQNARSMQILGQLDSSISLCVRPLAANLIPEGANNTFYAAGNGIAKYSHPDYFFKKKGQFLILPLSIIQQYNSHHPYGWNDGAMIQAKGYQSLISAGLYASLGPLALQLAPELVYAANSNFENNGIYGSNNLLSYKKLFPGQSSIRLSAGKLSIGLSTENLWWGPGINSSLLMSNNAPGFLHAFFGTRAPIKTAIGNFEWHLIGAKLEANEQLPYENFNLTQQSFSKDWRYFSALSICYHPKWVPGLFLGFNRGLQQYNLDIKAASTGFLNDYLPILKLPFQKKNVSNDDNKNTDQIASFFMRWLMVKAHAEFYLEYGFNDYGFNIRDYLMAPTHSAAYLVGFKKIVPLAKKEARLEMGVELTQLSQSPDYLIRDAGNWYIHNAVRQGYTNENQIMGAGAGLGANVQTITTTWVNGWKKLGVLFERVEHDPLNHKNNWIDISVGFLPQYKYQNIVFSGKIQMINSNNYAWDKDVQRFNLHTRFQILYLF